MPSSIPMTNPPKLDVTKDTSANRSPTSPKKVCCTGWSQLSTPIAISRTPMRVPDTPAIPA